MSPTAETSPDRAQEFMALYSAHQRQLYYYLVTLCANADEANEVFAATNLAAWENFSQFQSGTNFLAWIRQIGWNLLQTHRRANANHTVVLDPHVLEQVAANWHDDEADDTLRRESLAHCLGKLKPTDRELIRQRYIPGNSVQSLATVAGRSPNALSKVLGRIRSQLYDCIRQTLEMQERGTGS